MKVSTYNEFENCKVFGYYFNVCEYYYVNLNPIWIWIMYEFESYMNLNLKYSNIVVICIFQMVSANLS
jgi:hypothetical protein